VVVHDPAVARHEAYVRAAAEHQAALPVELAFMNPCRVGEPPSVRVASIGSTHGGCGLRRSSPAEPAPEGRRRRRSFLLGRHVLDGASGQHDSGCERIGLRRASAPSLRLPRHGDTRGATRRICAPCSGEDKLPRRRWSVSSIPTADRERAARRSVGQQARGEPAEPGGGGSSPCPAELRKFRSSLLSLLRTAAVEIAAHDAGCRRAGSRRRVSTLRLGRRPGALGWVQ